MSYIDSLKYTLQLPRWAIKYKGIILASVAVSVFVILLASIISTSLSNSSEEPRYKGKVFIPSGYTCLVVTSGGNGNYGFAHSTEVFDLEASRPVCNHSNVRSQFQVPGGVRVATGGLLGGGTTILVCGGMEEGSYKWSDKCTILGLDSIPTSGITMLKRRGGAQSLVLDQDTLWVTGGYNVGNKALNTTEYVRLSNGSTSGPYLPEAVFDHCLVRINATTALLSGGHDATFGGQKKSTWFYDIPSQKWTVGPDLLQERDSLSFGVIEDFFDGAQVVVVAGGHSSSGFNYNSTELLWLDGIGGSTRWISGPGLPQQIEEAAGLSTEDRSAFLLIGGFNSFAGSIGSIYKLQCSNKNCEWSQMDMKMDIARHSLVAFLAPDSLELCNK